MKFVSFPAVLLIALGVVTGAAHAAKKSSSGSAYVTTDETCPLEDQEDNTLMDGDSVFVWVNFGNSSIVDLFFSILDRGKDTGLEGELEYVCTDEESGLLLYDTGLTADELPDSLNNGKGNSLTLDVTQESSDGDNFSNDSFRKL